MKRYKPIYFEYYMMENTTSLIAKAIPKLADLFQEYGIDYCIIGGAALPAYNLNRATEDVDFLVYVSDKSKIEKLIGTYFRPAFSGSKRNLIHNSTGVRTEFLYSGEVSGGRGGLDFDRPSELSQNHNGVNIITLPNLIKYKLSSGIYGSRFKYLGDVQELIKLNNLPKEYASNNQFRNDLQAEYVRIWSVT